MELSLNLLSGERRRRIALLLSSVIWIAFLGTLGMTFYVNRYMPRGPSVPTGDIVCEFDGRGPCGEAHNEDLSDLNIPDWAKFLRRNFTLLFMGLGVAGIYFSTVASQEDEESEWAEDVEQSADEPTQRGPLGHDLAEGPNQSAAFMTPPNGEGT